MEKENITNNIDAVKDNKALPETEHTHSEKKSPIHGVIPGEFNIENARKALKEIKVDGDINKDFTQATKFVDKYCTDIKQVSNIQIFITNEVNKHFNFDNDKDKVRKEGGTQLRKYFKEKIKEIKAEVEQKTKEMQEGLILEIKKAKESEYDLDSVSGRNAIYREFADEYIKAHHVKCIRGKLRVYKDGIYPESDDEMQQIKKDIMNIGLSHVVNLSESNISAIIRLIEISTVVNSEICEPDNDKVLVVNNGILDINTWELQEFDPEKVYLSKLPVDYDINAKAPVKFKEYLKTTFEGNEEQLDLFQEMIGYTLVKNYKHQAYFFLLGPGGNGKGAAIATIRNLLGDHNVSSESLFQLSDHQHIDYHVANLCGKYANLCGDVGCKKIINTETIKKATSNTDPITARNPGGKPFQFINYAKMIFAMNRLPETLAFTTGDKRRICIIDFKNKISTTAKEINAIQDVFKNEGELPGILLWAIEGLKRLEANGKFSDLRSVATKGLEYERKSKPIRYFVEECLEEDATSIIPNVNMYSEFTKFREKSGAAELSGDEIKGLIMSECIEAGWYVKNRLIRVTSLPKNMQEALKDAGINQKSIRCFFGINIIKEESGNNPETTEESDNKAETISDNTHNIPLNKLETEYSDEINYPAEDEKKKIEREKRIEKGKIETQKRTEKHEQKKNKMIEGSRIKLGIESL